MPFQKGHKFGKGRPKSKKHQVDDWVKAHPYAVAELMQALYDKGIQGDRESAMYVIDRIKGKPKQQTEIDLQGGEELGAATIAMLMGKLHQAQQQLNDGSMPLLNHGNTVIVEDA